MLDAMMLLRVTLADGVMVLRTCHSGIGIDSAMGNQLEFHNVCTIDNVHVGKSLVLARSFSFV